ncbi:MAG: hypothetical protein ABI690_00565 [Chloroflexota bacterium]
MYEYNNIATQAHQRQADLLQQAEAHRLVTIAQGTRRFRFLGWRLPALHLGLLKRQPVSTRPTTQRTAADNI